MSVKRHPSNSKRIGKYLCKLGKLNVYYSFVLSNFNYCPLTWHFCGEVNTKKIEKIQERALRLILSTAITALAMSRVDKVSVSFTEGQAFEDNGVGSF